MGHDWQFEDDGMYWRCLKCDHRPDGYSVDPPCSHTPPPVDEDRCIRCERTLCHELDAYLRAGSARGMAMRLLPTRAEMKLLSGLKWVAVFSLFAILIWMESCEAENKRTKLTSESA